MLRFFGICLSGWLTALPVGAQPPAEREAAEKIIDRAIDARGGAKQVARLQSVKFKARCTLYSVDPPVSYTGTFWASYPDSFREELLTNLGGQPHRFVKVIKGEMSSMRIDDREVSPVNPTSVRRERTRLRQVYYCECLLPLKGKEVTLRLVGPAEANCRKAVAVEYRVADLPPETLYFDEQTGLLVKTQVKGFDESTGAPWVSEAYFHDYREEDGVLYPARAVTYKDGKLVSEFETTEFTPGVTHAADIFIWP